MKRTSSRVSMALAAALPTMVPVAAGAFAPAWIATGGRTATLHQVAFGDGPATGKRRGRRSHDDGAPKQTGPSHADMHGATRDSADQAYRKQYGF